MGQALDKASVRPHQRTAVGAVAAGDSEEGLGRNAEAGAEGGQRQPWLHQPGTGQLADLLALKKTGLDATPGEAGAEYRLRLRLAVLAGLSKPSREVHVRLKDGGSQPITGQV